MRSLMMVALADGQITESERHVIEQLAAQVGEDVHDVAQRIIDIKRYFIDVMVDLELFHEAVLQVARDLGWDEDTVDKIAARVTGASG